MSKRIVLYEALGFATIALFTGVNNLLLSGVESNLSHTLVALSLITMVAAPILYMTHRLVKHYYYIAEFLRVCAWCRRIESNGEWVLLEMFVKQSFDQATSHGVCPKCAETLSTTGHTKVEQDSE